VSQGNLGGLLVLEKSETNFYTPTMEQLVLTFANNPLSRSKMRVCSNR